MRGELKRRWGSIALLVAIVGSPFAYLQSCAAKRLVAIVADKPAMTDVLRIGLNMDQQSQYSGQAYLQNYLDNPGFEPGMEGHVIVVAEKPSTTGFKDDND